MPAPVRTARAEDGNPDEFSTEDTSWLGTGGESDISHPCTPRGSSAALSSRSRSPAVAWGSRSSSRVSAAHDRLGVVMSRPRGAVGASALLCATITAFYDIQRSRGPDFFIYPDYYLFHVGRPLGDHARLDVWPRRKEVVVSDEPQQILEAIDDRAITRLWVEDGAPGEPALEEETLASARERIVSCLAYSATGRVARPDVRIAANPVAEGYVEAV